MSSTQCAYIWLSWLFLLAPLMMAETPVGANSDLEGGFVVRRRYRPKQSGPRIDALTWDNSLLPMAELAYWDAYSTQRMLKNSCSSGCKWLAHPRATTSRICLDHRESRIREFTRFDGAFWLSEFATTRFLIQHHHRRIARFIPFIDFISTTSFAVNNLTLVDW